MNELFLGNLSQFWQIFVAYSLLMDYLIELNQHLILVDVVRAEILCRPLILLQHLI